MAEDPRRHVIALLITIICGALLWTSERDCTVTLDEPLHLIRGHAFWWTHDTRLSYAHPPLANAITSLAQAGDGDDAWGLGRRIDGEPRPAPAKIKVTTIDPNTSRSEALPRLRGWKIMQPMTVSATYFRHDFRAARAELTRARRIMMTWTLAFGLFLYVWADRRWGFVAGVVSLALYSLHPTILAHGRLVTTDIPIASALMLGLAATIRWIEAPSPGRAALFGLATAFMVLCKHSGLPLVVVMSSMVLGAAALGRGGFAERGRLRALGLVAAQLALIALVVIFAIDAIYMFDRVGLSVAEILAQPEPHNWISARYDYALLERSVIAKLPHNWRLPFPYTWIVGVATVSQQNAAGHGNYFFGLRASSGHPLYFPVMLLAKSPTTVLVLLGAGLGLVIARLRAGRWPSLTSCVLLIFAAVTLASACASRINIGVRHVLPLIPIMILFAGRSAQLLIEGEGPGVPRWLARGRRSRALVAIGLGLGLGTSVAGAAWTFPNWLGDFNVLVGGPAGGHAISVIGEDWGQDMDEVAELAHAQGWERVVYHDTFPLRREELQLRGLEVTKLRCKAKDTSMDPVVIHVSDWVRRRECYTWLGEREPSFVVNHHVLVFDRRHDSDPR